MALCELGNSPSCQSKQAIMRSAGLAGPTLIVAPGRRLIRNVENCVARGCVYQTTACPMRPLPFSFGNQRELWGMCLLEGGFSRQQSLMPWSSVLVEQMHFGSGNCCISFLSDGGDVAPNAVVRLESDFLWAVAHRANNVFIV